MKSPQIKPSWTCSDGKVVMSLLDARKHELFLYLRRTGDNEVGARNIVEALTKEDLPSVIEGLQDILNEMSDPKYYEVNQIDRSARSGPVLALLPAASG